MYDLEGFLYLLIFLSFIIFNEIENYSNMLLLKINFVYQNTAFIWFFVRVCVHQLNCKYSFCAHYIWDCCMSRSVQKAYFQKPAATWETENGLSDEYTKSILLGEYSANKCVYF